MTPRRWPWALTAIACVAGAILGRVWVVSYESRRGCIGVSQGCIFINLARTQMRGLEAVRNPTDLARYWLPRLRFAPALIVSVPLWVPALMSALLWWQADRVQRALIVARDRKMCPRCFYDRAALRGADPCPECGHVAPVA